MNLELLRKDIRDSGLKVSALAEKMNLSYQALYNKMNGKTEFTTSEIADYAQARGKPLYEVLPIFFGNDVD